MFGVACMKYLISIAISLGLFLVFRKNHHYTLGTWLYLLLMHAPVPAVMFAIERSRKVNIHPLICFVCTWLGGMILGFLVGPHVIRFFGSKP